MSDPRPPSPPPDEEPPPDFRRNPPSWATGCLISLLVLGLIFFFIVSVCTRA